MFFNGDIMSLPMHFTTVERKEDWQWKYAN
jgi:hypothetical protein